MTDIMRLNATKKIKNIKYRRQRPASLEDSPGFVLLLPTGIRNVRHLGSEASPEVYHYSISGTAVGSVVTTNACIIHVKKLSTCH